MAQMRALAQAGGFVSILVWGIVVVAALAVMLAAAAAFRRWLKSDMTTGSTEGFTLGELRDLQKQGKITPEQFERAKEKLVERAHQRGKAGDPTEPQPKPDVRQ